MEEDDSLYTYHFREDDSSGPPTNDDWKNANMFIKFLDIL